MSELGRKSLQTFAFKTATLTFGLLGSIAIARTVGANGKGIFTYAATVLAAIVVLNGQPAAIAWQYTKRCRAPAAILRLTLAMLAVISVPLVTALVAIGTLVAGQGALVWVGAAIVPALLVQSATGFFLADGDVRTVNVAQIISSVGPVVVFVPLLLARHISVWVVLAIWASGYALAAAYALARLWGRYAAVQSPDDAGAPMFAEYLRYAVQTGLNGLLLFLNFRIDVFIVVFMLGHTALGIYSVGLTAGETLWQLSRSITMASFGRIARSDAARSAEATATSARHSFALVVVCAAGIAALAPAFVPFVYGKAFVPAVAVTWLLLPGIVAYSMMGALTTFFTQQLGEPKLPLLFRTLSIVICALGTIALLPRFGIAGGAIATSASYVATFALASAYFARVSGMAPHRLFLFGKGDLLPYRSLLHGALQYVRGSVAKPLAHPPER